MKRVLGLTGGIASGKSTVSLILAAMGANIIDADIIARQTTESGSAALPKLEAAFGSQIFYKNGELNRRALGEMVFSDVEKKKTLEAILHPAITARISELINKSEGVCVIDAPLLIETGLNALCEEVWLVTARDDIRLQRIMERDSLSLEQAKSRMAAHSRDEVRARFADIIIDNSSDEASLRSEIKGIYRAFIEKEYK